MLERKASMQLKFHLLLIGKDYTFAAIWSVYIDGCVRAYVWMCVSNLKYSQPYSTQTRKSYSAKRNCNENAKHSFLRMLYIARCLCRHVDCWNACMVESLQEKLSWNDFGKNLLSTANLTSQVDEWRHQCHTAVQGNENNLHEIYCLKCQSKLEDDEY